MMAASVSHLGGMVMTASLHLEWTPYVVSVARPKSHRFALHAVACLALLNWSRPWLR